MFILLLLFSFFFRFESRYICYSNQRNVSILLDENEFEFILPAFFNFFIIDQIYSSDYVLVRDTRTSYKLFRVVKCLTLLSVSFTGLKDEIQIYTFEIRLNYLTHYISQFRLEIHQNVLEQRVELISDGNDLKMYINVLPPDSQVPPDYGVSYPIDNVAMKAHSSDTKECIFVKAKNSKIKYRVPNVAKLEISGIGKMVMLKIKSQYFYNNVSIDSFIELFAFRANCPTKEIGFDFVFKYKPKAANITLIGQDYEGNEFLKIYFEYQNNSIITKSDQFNGDIGFSPSVFDLNEALDKKSIIPNLLLEPLEMWGVCNDPSNKVINLEIYKKFGIIFFHYGLYPFPYKNISNLIVWRPLTYAELEDKFSNNQLKCF